MLLKNFGAYCATAFTSDTLQEGIKCTTGEFPSSSTLRVLPSQLGSLGYIVSSLTYSFNTHGSGSATWAFIFGDGTTPPTIEDYKLSGNIVEPSIIAGTGSASNGSNGSTWQMTVVNNTGSSITIGEIGLCTQMAKYGCVMLTRDVLPQPVVLEPGASKGFQIFIDTQSFVANASQV